MKWENDRSCFAHRGRRGGGGVRFWTPPAKGPAFSLRSFGMQSAVSKVYPELHSQVKAMCTRTLMIWLSSRCSELCNGTLRSRRRCALLKAFAVYFTTCGQHGLILPAPVAMTLKHLGVSALKLHQMLYAECLANGEFLWRMRPKSHMWDHNLRDLPRHRINPMYIWTLYEEDFLGKFKKMGQKTDPRTASKRMLLNALMYIGQRWDPNRFQCRSK